MKLSYKYLVVLHVLSEPSMPSNMKFLCAFKKLDI